MVRAVVKETEGQISLRFTRVCPSWTRHTIGAIPPSYARPLLPS